ncbi:hypothetical protein, partial [Phocaeicola sp.]
PPDNSLLCASGRIQSAPTVNDNHYLYLQKDCPPVSARKVRMNLFTACCMDLQASLFDEFVLLRKFL